MDFSEFSPKSAAIDAGSLTAAVDEWRTVVGDDWVLTDTASLSRAARSTFAETHGIPVIVCPGSAEEVSACLRIAQDRRVPLYPISCGKNWGLGSRLPVRPGNVLLDLHRMNRIVDYHEELGYLVVEPGVSFYQAAEFLAARQSRHFITPTGSTGHGSLIGNALERGDGAGLYGERVRSLAALEVVLPDGSLIRTGFGAFPGSAVEHTHPFGVGPSLDGLFVQSNLGVVTRATVYLDTVPDDMRLLMASIPSQEALAEMLDHLRPLLFQGVLPGMSVFLWNRYKFAARDSRFPWESGIRPPLPPEALEGPPWMISATLGAASAELGDAAEALLRKRLAGLQAKLSVVGADRLPPAFRQSLFAPREDNVKTTYWRKRGALPEQLDPDRDRCGVQWVCLALPLDGACIARVLGGCEQLALADGFEPHIGAGVSSPRSMQAFVSLMYDRDVEGEDERALRCHDRLLEFLTRQGIPPYRLGVQSMSWIDRRDPATQQFFERLKNRFDPFGVVAPGRYEMTNPSQLHDS